MWQKKIYKFILPKLAYQITKQYKLNFGNFGLKSLTPGLITENNLENLRRKLSKQFKRLNKITKFKLFIRIQLWKPFTSKPLLSRMGKGAGVIERWVALIKPGYIIMEMRTPETLKIVSKIVKRAIKVFPLKLRLLGKTL
jgi:large subunit ribosomal protein L16